MSIVYSNANCYSNNVNMFIVYANKYALSSHLKLNFVFGTNTDKCKRRIVLVYLQEGKNHEKQLLQAVLNKSC